MQTKVFGVVLCMLFGMSSISDAVSYYVTGTTGNNANDGRTKLTAWKTIQYGADRLAPGDSLVVSGGIVYPERVLLTKSGTATARITVRAATGTQPILDGSAAGGQGLLLGGNHLKYVTIQGFKTQNNVGRDIACFGNCVGVEIRDNEVTLKAKVAGQSNAIIVHSAVWPEIYSASDIVIDGNYVHDVATGTNAAYNEGITVAMDVRRFRVTNNRVINAAYIGIDTIGKTVAWLDGVYPNTQPIPPTPWPREGIIAGNTVCGGGTFEQDTGIYNDGASSIVVENNLVCNRTGYGFVPASKEDAPLAVAEILVRRNVAYGNTRQMWASNGAGVNHVRIVHNTLSTVTLRGIMIGGGDDVILRNNIVRSHQQPYLEHRLATNYRPTLNDNLYWPATGTVQYAGVQYASWGAYIAATGQDRDTLLVDPMFVSGTDYHLRAGSPGLNAGEFLTRTRSAGSGTAIPVGDARYFSNGYGQVQGDMIRVGAATVRVTAINRTTNTLTVTPGTTWSANAAVSYVYNGTAPDIGAYEH